MRASMGIAVVLVVGVVASAACSARTASACGDGMAVAPSPEDMVLSEAEGLLEAGHPAEAAEKISERFWFIRQSLPHAGTSPQFLNVMTVLALASARSGGAVLVGDARWVASDSARRVNRPIYDAAVQQNLDWSVSRLRMIQKVEPESSEAASNLAEALALDPRTRDEGKQQLEDLFARGGLAGRHAMDRLMHMRADGGDLEGARLVAQRCIAQNGDVCEAPAEVAVAAQ